MESSGDKQDVFEPVSREVDAVARRFVDACFAVHSALGPGLLESVYEACLEHELQKRGMQIQRQVEFPVLYRGLHIDAGLKIDLLVENCIVIELKAVEGILPVHKAQLMTYLKLTGHRLGFLINFNVPLIHQGISRFVK